jgi:hypothetical protein
MKNRMHGPPVNKQSIGGKPDQFNASVQTGCKFAHIGYLFLHTEWTFKPFYFSQVPNRFSRPPPPPPHRSICGLQKCESLKYDKLGPVVAEIKIC